MGPENGWSAKGLGRVGRGIRVRVRVRVRQNKAEDFLRHIHDPMDTLSNERTRPPKPGNTRPHGVLRVVQESGTDRAWRDSAALVVQCSA